MSRVACRVSPVARNWTRLNTCMSLEIALQWRHDGRDGVSNHQPHECLLNRLIRCRSKKTSKLRVTGLCAGNSPETGEFPAQMASNAENVSIWWRHHVARALTNGLVYFVCLGECVWEYSVQVAWNNCIFTTQQSNYEQIICHNT